MCIIKDLFILWKEILNVFSRFGGNKFSFLNNNNDKICVLDYVL